jgi:predicted Zn-dependent protease
MSHRFFNVTAAGLVWVVLAVSAPVPAQDLPAAQAARFSEGVAALKAGQLDAAERAFRDVLADGGGRSFVHHNLGIVLQRRGRHREALAAFRTALKLDPRFGAARLLAGTSLLALGRPKEAIAELERAGKLLPDEPAVRLQLADAYERTGNVLGLVNEYRALAAREPQNGEYAYRLSKAYLRLAQWSYERIRAIDPKSPRLSQALAEQYLAQGRPDLAVGALEEAARAAPDLPGIHLALARVHFDGGRLDPAAAAVARELAIAPESAAARELQQAINAARANR